MVTSPNDYGLLQAFTRMKGKRSQSNLMLSLDPNLPNNSLGITVMKELNYSFGHTLGVLVEVPFTINVSDLGQSGMN